MFYEDIFRALQNERIEYVVVGGVALVLHGVVRFTADLDLIVALEKNNLDRFIQLITDLGYVPRVPVQASDLSDESKRQDWIEEKNMKVFTFYDKKSEYKQIDVFLQEPIPFKQLKSRKKTVHINDIQISICSKEDLIKLKKQAGRPQDMADIEALDKLNEESSQN